MNTDPAAPLVHVWNNGGEWKLTTSIESLVELVDLLSPSGLKAMLLLCEPVGNAIPQEDGWAEHILRQRGMCAEAAEAGATELAAKGLLPGIPLLLSDLRREPSPPTGPAHPQRPRCRTCGGPSAPAHANRVTYVVRRGRFIKIGTTIHLDRRLAELAQPRPHMIVPAGFDEGSPLLLLGTTKQHEHDLHEHLSPYHAAGEWFRYSPALARALREYGEMA